MKFFFPDSQDQVDPSFDFQTELRSRHRLRQRDDLYAHEALGSQVYDGLLLSRAIVEGTGVNGGRYTIGQRHRLYREGVRRFFRLDKLEGPELETIGDCGAFSYVQEKVPPVTVPEVIEFYELCGFDIGVSIDHVILGFKSSKQGVLSFADDIPEDWRERQHITLELAREFWKEHRQQNCRFEPMGAAQGWSAESYAHSVDELQKMGYTRIGLGGMVPLKTEEILESLAVIKDVLKPKTQLHLFGVTRCEHINQFAKFGVTSFDSTSPFRQAFKDERNNYYFGDEAYTAIRVPQVDGNPKLKRQIKAGKISQQEALKLERHCLSLLDAYDQDQADVEEVLTALREYEILYDGGKKNRKEAYRKLLVDRPWKRCACNVCKTVGIHVPIFRGAERNKRRGFHNLFVFNQRLHAQYKAHPWLRENQTKI